MKRPERTHRQLNVGPRNICCVTSVSLYGERIKSILERVYRVRRRNDNRAAIR